MEIEIGDFDQVFFDSLEDKNCIHPPSSGRCYYHTLFIDGQKAGIVGYIAPKIIPEEKKGIRLGLVQIILLPNYRGKGLTEKAENLIFKKYKLEELWAKIKINNITSLKTHLKAGFNSIEEKVLAKWRQIGILKEDEIILEKKCYQENQ